MAIFYFLAYIFHGNDTLGFQVRSRVINHVSSNWRRFKALTAINAEGGTYNTKAAYVASVSKPTIFGSPCEVMAATEIYSYQLKIYRDGVMLKMRGVMSSLMRELGG